MRFWFTKVHNLFPVLKGQAIADEEERVRVLSRHCREDTREIRRSPHFP